MSRKRYPLRVTRDAYGIRAQELRTLARTAWWARRWIAALEEMRLGPRFGRGRQYAVSGQVTDLILDGPHVEATVVGSRETPYKLTLDFTSAQGDALARISSAIGDEPMRLARLLTDDMPTEIDELFRRENLPLFPQAAPRAVSPDGRPAYDVKMHCSCPDWARPCKHLVAVMLLLGEEVARRPSALLSLRGIDIDELLEQRGLVADREAPDCQIEVPDGRPPDRAGIVRPTAGGQLVKRLGPIPFWRGRARCVEALTKLYGRACPVATEAAEGRSIDLRC